MFCPGTQPDWCGRQRGAGILWFELDTTNHLLHSRPLKQCDVFERSMLILLNIIINKRDQSVQFSIFQRMKMSPSPLHNIFNWPRVFFHGTIVCLVGCPRYTSLCGSWLFSLQRRDKLCVVDAVGLK